jgi:hypothetical protein
MNVLFDSDMAAHTSTRRLQQSGEVVMLNGDAINRTSKQQDVFAMSINDA